MLGEKKKPCDSLTDSQNRWAQCGVQMLLSSGNCCDVMEQSTSGNADNS